MQPDFEDKVMKRERKKNNATAVFEGFLLNKIST